MENATRGRESLVADLLLAPPAQQAGPLVVVAAHPDDETIGASWAMQRARDLVVVYLTDGAPLDAKYRARGFQGPRSAYATRRHSEALSALGMLQPQALRTVWLGLVDQQASSELEQACRALGALLEELRPGLVIAHPYEGGHPDHDAAAFATHTTLEMMRRRTGQAPPLLEMTSYHAADGQFRAGRFLREDDRELVVHLSPEQVALKQRMLSAYASQREVLGAFETREERYRVAAHEDFSRPPHPGLLYYELLGWPMHGWRFCYLARKAQEALGLVQEAAE